MQLTVKLLTLFTPSQMVGEKTWLTGCRMSGIRVFIVRKILSPKIETIDEVGREVYWFHLHKRRKAKPSKEFPYKFDNSHEQDWCLQGKITIPDGMAVWELVWADQEIFPHLPKTYLKKISL